MAMEHLKEAIKRRRMSHSAATENAEAPEFADGELAKAHQAVEGKTAVNVDNEFKKGALKPSPMHVADNTEHESDGQKVSPSDDDGDDDMAMVEHLTSNMSDADKDYSSSHKPRSLGERVKQHAMAKASKMKHHA